MKTKEQKAWILNLANLLLCIIGYSWYCWQNVRGNTHPNVSSWTIWSFILVLNFTSYKQTTGNWRKSLFTAVNSMLVIITTLVLLILGNGTFRSLTAVDIMCIVIGVVAALGWWYFKSSRFAQIAINTAIIVGFIPTVIGVAHNPTNESWFPWFILSVTNVTQCFVIKFTGKGGWIEYLNPVNQMIFNGLVFILALR